MSLLAEIQPGEVFHQEALSFEAALEYKAFYLATTYKPINIYTGKILDAWPSMLVQKVNAKAVVSKL